MAIDLGSLIGQVFGGVADYQMAKLALPPQFQMPVTDSPYIPNIIEGPIDRFLSGGAMPQTQTVKIDAAGNVYACPKRRRRKRLATVSDIRDLAALKSVLGGGEAFKTWIATHSR